MEELTRDGVRILPASVTLDVRARAEGERFSSDERLRDEHINPPSITLAVTRGLPVCRACGGLLGFGEAAIRFDVDFYGRRHGSPGIPTTCWLHRVCPDRKE